MDYELVTFDFLSIFTIFFLVPQERSFTTFITLLLNLPWHQFMYSCLPPMNPTQQNVWGCCIYLFIFCLFVWVRVTFQLNNKILLTSPLSSSDV